MPEPPLSHPLPPAPRCSVQGYGPKAPGYPAFVYPGSGATCDTKQLAEAKAAAEAQAAAEAAAAAAAEAAAEGQNQQNGVAPAAMDVDGPQAASAAVKAEPSAAASGGAQQAAAGQAAAAGAGQQDCSLIEEDPDHEFEYKGEAFNPSQRPLKCGSSQPAAACSCTPGCVLRRRCRPNSQQRFMHACYVTGGETPTLEGPRVIDVGIPGFGSKPA